MANITKELAIKIRDKLDGREMTTKNAVHDIYGVFHENRLVATFGIRRGSKKDAGHDHIPRSLNVPAGFAKQLGVCTRSREDYLRLLQLLPPEPSGGQAPPLPSG
jgi:hypothetical protein